MSHLSEMLKRLRVAAGLSQKDLERACGVPQPQISLYEKGTSEPVWSNVVKLAEALGVGVEVFTGRAAGQASHEEVEPMAGKPDDVKRALIRRILLAESGLDDREVARRVKQSLPTCGHGLVAQVRREMVRAREIIGLDGRQENIVIRGGFGFTVPYVGPVAAGPPLDEPADEPHDRITVNDFYPPDTVAYLVRGTSMIDACIDDGDYVLVRPNPDPDSGTIVVAWIKDQGATLKKWVRGKKELRSRNEKERWTHKMRPDEDRILGVYVGVVRKV